ncbi:heterokaryon incompatibility [Fusarium sporotrichioides]|uniref:Heterokaryon incompatibility n=1 Tax=Fusarium sporotrichioides TaxID=5514 RepID=A0A395SJ97_FUSSP|nr:heterokaryon incompatibility [Fusarium sporotrichioides]
METFDRLQYQIALVAPRRQDYDTTALLLQDKCSEYSFKTSRALCTRGKIGPHHFLLAGDSGDYSDIALFVHDTTNDLLTEFPCIRVGFLIGVDAIAPADGIAKAGDIVVGTPQGLEPGLVQFDAHQTILLSRLSVTHQISHPPYAVQSVIDRLRSKSGRHEYQEELFNKTMIICSAGTEQENLSWSKSVRVLHGKIASSQENLPEDDIIKTARDSKVLCFERAAAKLKSQLPFLTICRVTKTTNAVQSTTREQRSGVAAVIYAMLLAGKIDSNELQKQHNFTSLFSYEPFGLDRPGFRLIQLERGVYSPLRCSLFQAYLDEEESIIPYEALSYVWGSQSMPNEITVDGKTMSITTSLYDALHYLRQQDQDRLLWVDALCIDQSNTKERSHQVNHMGDIYQKADNVIIWLGYLSGDAALFKTAVDQFARQLPSEAFRRWPREDPRWRDTWRQVESSFGFPNNTRLINGLSTFMGNPWFMRVWVLQEVANAKRAIIESNLGKIHTKLFALLPHVIGSPVSDQCRAVLDIMPGPLKYTSWWNQDRNICTLLCKFKGSEASDPRDKVYALMGMASDMDSNAIEADYTKEEEMIVQDLCLYIYGDRIPVRGFSITSIREFQSRLSTISTRLLINMLERKATAQSLLLFMGRHGMLKDVGDIALQKLLDHGSYLVSIYLSKCETPFLVNFQTATRSLVESPDLFDYFFQRKQIPPVLLKSIASWMVATNYHGLESFLGRVRLEMDPGPDLLMNLMTYGPTDPVKLLKLVFEAFRKPIELDEIVFTRAIDENEVVLKLILQHCQHPIMVTNKVLVKAISAGIETLRTILETPRQAIRIEGDSFDAAITQGSITLQFLLDQCDGGVSISEQLLRSAIKLGRNSLEKILEMSSGIPVRIDGSVFIVAAAQGPRTVQLLFDHCHHPVYTARVAIYTAASYDPRTLENLLELCPFKIELRKDLFVRAMAGGPATLRLLFQYCIRPINVTDKMLELAIRVGIPVLEVIFENWASDVETTELVTKQAAVAGVQALTYLSENSKGKLQITDNILEQSKAVDSSYQMLLRLRRSETNVTEEEAIRAIESGPETFLELFNRPGTNFRLTEKICKVAREHDYVFRVLKKKRPSELFIYKREVFFQGSASLESDADRILEERGFSGWEHISVLSEIQVSTKNICYREGT